MADKRDVGLGTLSLMVLKTLETIGLLLGYGIARRIDQISGEHSEQAAILSRFLSPAEEA